MGWIKHNFDLRGHVCPTPDLNDAAIGSIWSCDDCQQCWIIMEVNVTEWDQPAGFGGGTVVRTQKSWLPAREEC